MAPVDRVRGALRIAVALACSGLALVVAGSGLAADGGSGTYAASGSTYDFDLVNTGTTPWLYFMLVAPAGTTFIGGATAGEITVHCVPGQPDGQANEIECGPVSATGLQPNVHVVFVATLGIPAVCGSPFQLDVSSTGAPPFTRVGDATSSGTCAAVQLRALTPPTIHGARMVGRIVTATAPVWSATPARLVYQWQLCSATGCRSIKGATKLALKLVAGEAGRSVRIVVTASASGATVMSVSPKVAVRASA